LIKGRCYHKNTKPQTVVKISEPLRRRSTVSLRETKEEIKPQGTQWIARNFRTAVHGIVIEKRPLLSQKHKVANCSQRR